MRTVREPLIRRFFSPCHKKERRPAVGHRNTTPGIFTALYGVAFLLGYIPGLWLHHSGFTQFSDEMIQHYLNKANYITWSHILAEQCAAAFLQLTVLYLCAFSAFGCIFLSLLAASHGAFLGLCAAGAVAYNGVKGLIVYWLLGVVPDLCVVLLWLWLATYAAPLSVGVFKSVFLCGGTRGELPVLARRLNVHFAIGQLSALVLCVISSNLTVFLAGIVL